MDRLDAARRGSAGHPRVRKPVTRAIVASALSLLLLVVSLLNVLAVPTAQAAPSWGLPPSASCAALAQLDRSATNGGDWGKTLFAGHNAPGGWFGVDVCGNGINASAPNGANVSCDHIPDNWPKTGCAPGGATSDGYGLTFQCVELIIRFSAWAFGDSASSWGRSGYGNAPDLWLPANHPSDWVMYPNGSSHAPVPGDILVWGELDAQGRPYPAGPTGAHDGHIAVVAGVRDGVVITAEQNVKWGTSDHPSDALALTKVGPQWILSGSSRRATSLPTYRWQSTMGNTRATYGWLHNIHNTGVFPARNVPTTAKPAKPATTPAGTGKPTAKPTATPAATTAAPTQPSGGLPSLASSAVVTTDGVLADLSWSKTDLFATATTGDGPSAHVRSLGAPPGVHLIANQTVSTVVLPDGTRYRYVVGADGNLYSARTAPDLFGVQWTDLGAPSGIQLQPSPSASAYAGGVGVAALGTDGNLWWRAGPASSPGGWLPAGHPDATELAGGFGLAGQPGSGSPLLLALGQNGRVYERIWQPAMLNPDGSTQVPAGWSDWLALHAQLAAVHLSGTLLLVPELQNTRSWLGAWPDAPLDVLASDTLGNLWWMRSVSPSTGWTFSAVRSPHPITSLLAAVSVAHAAASASASPSGTPTATSATPAPSTTPSAPTADTVPAAVLHLYAATVAGPYLGAVALSAAQSSSHDSRGQPVWTQLSPLPAAMSSATAGTALALGTDASALVAPMGNEVLVGGLSSATSTLQATSTLSIAPAAGASNPWLEVGSVSGAAPFADTLTGTTVDKRWHLAGPGATASPSTRGLRLAAGSAGVAALLQSASAGDASAQVQVTLPAQGGANVTGGLLLYLDGSDWLTFTASGAGHVAFCVTVRQAAAPCQGTTLKALPASRTLWLRVARADGAFTGAYSTDGQTWVSLGSWSVPATSSAGTGNAQATAIPSVTPMPATPSPTAATSATATPASTSAKAAAITNLAPAAFTQWGLYTTGDPNTPGWPLFHGFTLTAAPGQ